MMPDSDQAFANAERMLEVHRYVRAAAFLSQALNNALPEVVRRELQWNLGTLHWSKLGNGTAARQMFVLAVHERVAPDKDEIIHLSERRRDLPSGLNHRSGCLREHD